MKVLIAEPLAAAGIELLKAQPGWEIVVSNPKEYSAHLADCDALIVRSAVQVTQRVLENAPKLRVIGRAGVGVDNVDLYAATAAGVLVMNTPGGNAVAVAEHTMALMLAMARAIPQASSSTKSGKFEKKKFLGNEVRGKTLGVVGLGSIGREVVRRARAFEMRIIGCDPFVSPQTVAGLNLELTDLNTLFAQSDYITLHVALTPETEGMVSAAAIAGMKSGARIINCARGELIDPAALAAAIRDGKIAGAGLDVFSPEPPPAGYDLFELDSVIATPHIGGSTEEAQETVGVRIVEQMVEYLKNGVAINAVNMPAVSPEQYKMLGPYITLAERLGVFASHVATGNPSAVRIAYSGRIAELNTQLLRNAGLSGVLGRSIGMRANVVNAMQIAAQRGLSVSESHSPRSGYVDSIRLELETESGVTAVDGAVILDRPRLMQVDGIQCECTLAGRLIFMQNDDVPGVIGHVGGVLGKHRINIANFSLGREAGPSQQGLPLRAMALVETDEPVPESVLAELRGMPAVKLTRMVEFVR